MKPVKFTHFADKIAKDIIDGIFAPGDLLPSQHTLAAKYQLSRSCVQKVFDLLDERGLIERKPGKGIYVKSKELEAEKLESIVYFVGETQRTIPNTLDNYGLEMLWGVEEKARELGINLILRRYSPEDLGNLAAIAGKIKTDGIVFCRDIPDEALGSTGAVGRPAVICGRTTDISTIGSTAPNFVDAFMRLFASLIENSYSDIDLFFSSAYSWTDDFIALREQAGRKWGNKINFIDWNSPGIPVSSMEERGHFEKVLYKTIKNKMSEIMVFASDWFAIKAIELLSKKGIKVPDDLKIIGCYGLEFGKSSTPPLTTLRIDPRELGRKAVQMLNKMVLTKAPPTTERIPLIYLERETFKFLK